MHSVVVCNFTKPPLRGRNYTSKRRVAVHKSLIHFKPCKARGNKSTSNDQNITGIYNASRELFFGGKETSLSDVDL
jgi:hypothetical protein